jgi:hypothetical protein
MLFRWGEGERKEASPSRSSVEEGERGTAWRRPFRWNGTFTYVCSVPRVAVTWLSDLSTGRRMGL